MKSLKTLFAVATMLAAASFANAQSDKIERAKNVGLKTEIIKVSGTCDMDKHRIEKAAYGVDGVKSAIWSLDDQALTIKYGVFRKEAPDNVQRKVAAAGNDTEKYKADDATYMNLPECCHYRKINI